MRWTGDLSSLLLLPALAVALNFCYCQREKPPRTPIIGGPSFGQPNETLAFWGKTTDPNRDNISYIFNWGDGTEPEKSAEIRSLDTIFMRHCYTDTGVYYLTVQAQDEKGNKSEISAPLGININFYGPITPQKPSGPTLAYPDTPLVFTTTATHRFSESVAVQFDFGDTTSNWSSYFPSGETASMTHTYRTRGNFLVRTRAKDRKGNQSPWSEPALILIDFPPFSAPTNLRLSAHLGVQVNLRWNKNRNHDSVLYGIWFRTQDSTLFRLIAITLSTHYIHDPLSTTGEYTLSARFRDKEIFATETLSTIPVFSETLLITELNAQGPAGYGWDSVTFQAKALSMRDTASARICAVYLTNFSLESLNLPYYLTSAHLAPTDPGNVTPPASWRSTYLLDFTGNIHSPLPEFDPLVYRDRVSLHAQRTDIALYLPQGNYALLSTFPDNHPKTKLISWYQRIPNLRLISPSAKP